MKKSGVALLATIISIAVLLLVSGGFFTIMASNTGLIKSGGESLQAQYFAQLEADTIKMLSYDEVDNITQDTWQEFDIDNSWQYKVNVGPEQNVGDSDNTMKIASISVRKNGDTINRFALDVPLSSQSNSLKFKGLNAESMTTFLPEIEYTASQDGWLIIRGMNHAAYSLITEIYIDGVSLPSTYLSFGVNDISGAIPVLLPIVKGQRYKVHSTMNAGTICIFVPCK